MTDGTAPVPEQKTTAPVPAQKTQQEAAPAASPEDAGSFIGADVSIRGTVITQRPIRIDARIEGEIRASSLALGQQAYVKGSVVAEEVTIAGRLDGDVTAARIQLGPTAEVNAKLTYETMLCITSGALYRGDCRKAGGRTDAANAAVSDVATAAE
jgi:cytoskeletal protein CcmA (bactofilin family)